MVWPKKQLRSGLQRPYSHHPTMSQVHGKYENLRQVHSTIFELQDAALQSPLFPFGGSWMGTVSSMFNFSSWSKSL